MVLLLIVKTCCGRIFCNFAQNRHFAVLILQLAANISCLCFDIVNFRFSYTGNK